MAERIAVYEWCCSGGAARGPAGAASLPASFLREGRAMFLAVLRDAATDPGFVITAILGRGGPVTPDELPAGVGVRWADARHPDDVLVDVAAGDGSILLIAPESDGELARLAGLVRTAGGRALLPGDGFIELASDKHDSLLALAAAGLPVPAGRLLLPGESPAPGFRLPAARKANGGAGCEGLQRVDAVAGLAPAATGRERVEFWEPGTPVGVSLLCGPSGVFPLAACVQSFEGSDRPTYVGGRLLADGDGGDRALALGCRSVRALIDRAGPAAGWVGVDMILGSRADGRDDRVLEINPRLTTSFVGLSVAAGGGLVRMIGDAAMGRQPDARGPFAPFSFRATGEVAVDAV